MQDKLVFKVNLNRLKEIANVLSKYLKEGDCLALYGNLGAGKTTFTSFLVKALNIEEKVSSPTFTLINEYSSSNMVIKHIDAYRLSMQDDIGIEEFLTNSLVIIEWPENLEKFLPSNHMKIFFEYSNDEERELTFKITGNYKQKFIEELVKIRSL